MNPFKAIDPRLMNAPERGTVLGNIIDVVVRDHSNTSVVTGLESISGFTIRMSVLLN